MIIDLKILTDILEGIGAGATWDHTDRTDQ
jgi:hypothetical protein